MGQLDLEWEPILTVQQLYYGGFIELAYPCKQAQDRLLEAP